MADIINLRRARKDRTRKIEAAKADQNRVSFGRSKAEKCVTKAQSAIDQARHESHRIIRVDKNELPE